MRIYRTLLLIVLVVIVPVAVLLVAVWLYIGQEAPSPPEEAVVDAQPEPASPPQVEVFAAAHDLSVGTLLTANDIDTDVPRDADEVLSSHMPTDQTELSAVVGSVVRTELLAGQPLTSAALIRPGQEGFLTTVLAPDSRAVTIVVNQETSHAGLIAPGDRVDIIFTMQVASGGASPLSSFSRTILEDIRVVAVDRRVVSEPESEENGGEGGDDTVTLEVLPSEADQLVLATTRGSISLTLRPLRPADRSDGRPPTGLATLLPPPATPEPGPDPVRVQVFRGNSHEEVLLLQ